MININVLIVDDQINVVNGLLSGIKWDELAVAEVYKAFNTLEAKDIIRERRIDILLCDIEMPQENGLSLFRWIKENNLPIECIFLTAHADFSFAREAVKLGGFDYILQPAPYEEIQNAILRVKQKIHIEKQMQKYSTYGEVLYQKKDMLLDSIVKDWFLGKPVQYKPLLKDLEQLQICLKEEYPVHFGILQITSWEEDKKTMEPALLRYALHNILTELLEAYECSAIMSLGDADEYEFLIYSDNNDIIGVKDIKNTLDYFMTLCKEYFGCKAACYISDNVYLNELTGQVKELVAVKKDNVALLSRIFCIVKRPNTQVHPQNYEFIKNWKQILMGGNPQQVKKEAFSYLSREHMDSQALKRFYQEFMQMVSGAIEQLGISHYQLFSEKSAFEKSLTAYQTIEAMKELIDYVVIFFTEAMNNDDKNYIEMVIQYINLNIEKDVRRSDIAKIVNLNEDYLSRLFKKEKGISLKEFIIMEKMQAAKNLLKTTNFSVSIIAAKVGFTNFSHFSQMYKKIMGITPAEERL